MRASDPPRPVRLAALRGSSHLALLASLLLHGVVAGALLQVISPARQAGEDGASLFAMRVREPLETQEAQPEELEPDRPPSFSLSMAPALPQLPDARASEATEMLEPLAVEPAAALDDPLEAALEAIVVPRGAWAVPPAPAPGAPPASAPEPDPTPAPLPAPVRTPSAPASAKPAATGLATLRVLHQPRLLDFYPPESLRRGEEGTVQVEFRVDADGWVREARLLESSGHVRLDAAALDLVRAFRFAAPGEATLARRPIVFVRPPLEVSSSRRRGS